MFVLSDLLSIFPVLLHQLLLGGVRKAVVIPEAVGCFHEL